MNIPEWFKKDKIRNSLDARPMLAGGIHPLEQVQQQCAALLPGEIFEIITPFPPAPMLEKMAAAGYDTFSETDEQGLIHSYFRK